MHSLDVSSEMIGVVWKVLVAVGDAVVLEQPLMLLEAMKMEIPVHAPAAGIITEVFVSEADRVRPGDLLLRLKTSASCGA